MSWGAPIEDPNPVYLAAVSALVKRLRETDSTARVHTCALCGCWYLPKIRGATECSSCYGREVRLMHEAVDREGYARHVELNGTLIDRWGLPQPVKPDDGDLRLFEDVA